MAMFMTLVSSIVHMYMIAYHPLFLRLGTSVALSLSHRLEVLEQALGGISLGFGFIVYM